MLVSATIIMVQIHKQEVGPSMHLLKFGYLATLAMEAGLSGTQVV